MNRKRLRRLVVVLVLTVGPLGASQFLGDTRADEPAAGRSNGTRQESGSIEARKNDTSDNSAARTFSDISGKHSVQAVLVDENGGKVRLKKSSGEIISVPIEKLSRQDQQWIKQRSAMTAGVDIAKPNTAASAESGTAISNDTTHEISRLTREVSQESIDYSLALLTEARQSLVGVTNASDAKILTQDLDTFEKKLKVLSRVKKEGLGPLQAHIRENHADYSMPAWVRALCAADMPKEAEELAQEPATQASIKPSPLWCIGRYYANRGNRKAAIRVLSQAAAQRGLVSINNDGSVSDNSILLTAFPKTSDVDAIISVSTNLKDPGERLSLLLGIARRCKDDGKFDKAKEVLASAPGVLDAALAGIPEALRMHFTAPFLMRVSVVYGKLDAEKSNEFAERALAAARKVRDAQVAANAMQTVAGNKLGPVTGPMPSIERSKQVLMELARGFRTGADQAHARVAFQLYRDVGESGVPKDRAIWSALAAAMELACCGEYTESSEIIKRVEEHPQEDLIRSMQQAKVPTNAEEARSFVRAYRSLPRNNIDPMTRTRMIYALVLAGEIDEARKIVEAPIVFGDRTIQPAPGLLTGPLAAANRVAETEKELAKITDAGARTYASFEVVGGFLSCGNLNEASHYLDLTSGALPSGDNSCLVRQQAAFAFLKAGRYAEAVRYGAQTKDFQRGPIIDELCRRERWDDAQRLAGIHPPPLVRWNDYLREMCRRNQARALFAAMLPSGGNTEFAYRAAGEIARNWATVADPKTVVAWARELKSPAFRCTALIEAAKGNALANDPLIPNPAFGISKPESF